MNELVNKKEKWELLFEYIIKMDYATTILHSEIEEVIKESQNTPKYYSIIGKTKKKLLEASKTIKSLAGQGYSIVNPDEYTDISLKHIKSGFNKIDKGYQVLQYAPVNEMSKEGLEAFRHVSDRAKTLHAMIAGGCTELKLLNKKKSKLVLSNSF